MTQWREKFPFILFGTYLLFTLLLALHPYDRAVWWAENLPLFLIVLTLAILFRSGVRFSHLSYLLMSILLFLHTVGGHYTFEREPFEWFDRLLGFERNMYDRVAHFTVGFYAFAIAEWLERSSSVNNRIVLFLFPLFAIAFVAMGYELIEWLYALQGDPSAGAAFLGSQGDSWDAQEDMLADTLGALFILGLYALLRKPTSTTEYAHA